MIGNNINIGRNMPERFNVLVVGSSNVGKKSLAHALLSKYKATSLVDHATVAFKQFDSARRVEVQHFHSFQTVSASGGLKFSLYCTSGYDDFIDNREAVNDVKSDLEKRHQQWLDIRSQAVSEETRLSLDNRIHCILYLVGAHGMKEIDELFIRTISGLAPIVPIIYRSDGLSNEAKFCALKLVEDNITAASLNLSAETGSSTGWCCYDFDKRQVEEPSISTVPESGASPNIPAQYQCKPVPGTPPGPCSFSHQSIAPNMLTPPLLFHAANLHEGSVAVQALNSVVFDSPGPGGSAFCMVGCTSSAGSSPPSSLTPPQFGSPSPSPGAKELDRRQSNFVGEFGAFEFTTDSPDLSVHQAAVNNDDHTAEGESQAVSTSASTEGLEHLEGLLEAIQQRQLYRSTCNAARSLFYGEDGSATVGFFDTSQESTSCAAAEQYSEIETFAGCTNEGSRELGHLERANVFIISSASVYGGGQTQHTDAPVSHCDFARLQAWLFEEGVHLRAMKRATQNQSIALYLRLGGEPLVPHSRAIAKASCPLWKGLVVAVAENPVLAWLLLSVTGAALSSWVFRLGTKATAGQSLGLKENSVSYFNAQSNTIADIGTVLESDPLAGAGSHFVYGNVFP